MVAPVTLIYLVCHIISLAHSLQLEEGSDSSVPKVIAASADEGKKNKNKHSSKSSVNASKQSKPSVNGRCK